MIVKYHQTTLHFLNVKLIIDKFFSLRYKTKGDFEKPKKNAKSSINGWFWTCRFSWQLGLNNKQSLGKKLTKNK